ncbi:MAG: hypothetical protein Ct9H90mP2_15330 [Dehalococcoidia bacterium]|nr:MAG: hypothetical protein Ct9H90mP2_15330 [Dehalococcoidia bacterium]
MGLLFSRCNKNLAVDGKFTSDQKDIYEIVLEANNKAIEECKIGNTIIDPHKVALKT